MMPLPAARGCAMADWSVGSSEPTLGNLSIALGMLRRAALKTGGPS